MNTISPVILHLADWAAGTDKTKDVMDDLIRSGFAFPDDLTGERKITLSGIETLKSFSLYPNPMVRKIYRG